MPLELIAGLLGLAFASALLPLVTRWARELSLLDIPDDDRRRHAVPTPRVGGVAIFVAVVLATAIVLTLARTMSEQQIQMTPIWPALLLGAAIVWVTGLVDDIRGVVPMIKLIAHATAAMIVIAAGFKVETITLAGGSTFSLGFLAIPVTILWIVGLTNAFNLIDGVDGLATTFALIGLTMVLLVEMMLGSSHSLIITTATLGAMLAFMRHNRPPAKIFLGDSGSTTLGFLLAIQLVVSATNQSGITYAGVPLFALAYPITDTMIAIARRWLRGHPFSRADGRHIHHQLLAIGLSPRRTVDLLGLLFASVAVMGIAIAFAPARITLALVTGGSILMFALFVYGVRWLGYHEFSEFASSVVSVVRNARRHVQHKIRASDLAGQLSKAKSLEELRLLLGGAAEELGLLEVTLETESPHFVGPAHRRLAPISQRPFRIDIPIAWEYADGHIGEATLRFWCERPNTFTHIGVERLATNLSAGVQQWFEANGHQLPQPSERRHAATEGRTEHFQPARRHSQGTDTRTISAALDSIDGTTTLS